MNTTLPMKSFGEAADGASNTLDSELVLCITCAFRSGKRTSQTVLDRISVLILSEIAGRALVEIPELDNPR